MADDSVTKSEIRKRLRQTVEAMGEAQRHEKSLSACALLSAAPEFAVARVVMLYLSMPGEVETAPLAIKAWQAGKTVVVPKVSWGQKHMLPVEISSLTTGLTTTGPGVREPISGKPLPVNLIDLVVVPGLAFSADGYRLGRGMGFYDRFLAQEEFLGISCGLAFSEQIVPTLPVQPHDVALSMLASDSSIRRFASHCIAGA